MEKTSMKQLIDGTAFVAKKTKKETEEIVKAFIEGIKLSLCKGNAVTVRDLGTFKLVHRKARQGYNPVTGETIIIPEKDTVKFVVSKAFKDVLNG